MADIVETDTVETGGAEKMGPGKIKADAVIEDLAELSGAPDTERASGRSEDVENAGAKVMSKRPKS